MYFHNNIMINLNITRRLSSILLLLLAVLVQQLAELHHAVQLVRRVAQQRLQVAHEPVHVPAKIFTYRQKYLYVEKNI